MSDRRRILEEMGIAPLWVLREPFASQFRGSEAAADASAAGDAEAVPAAPATPTTAVASGEAGEAREVRIRNMDWGELRETVRTCTTCGLHATRGNTVFGVGDEKADWMLIGEAPGSEEDRLGEPFVGQAGKLLDNMLAALQLTRGTNVYIANVLKCRPPGNRNPEPEEVARCSPHLLRQIALIQPKLIVAMGRFAAQTLLNTDATIASLRGKVHYYAGVPLIVTYHPAYLLRNLPDKSKAWQDLLFAAQTASPGKIGTGEP